jgi:hypothetical protein
VERILNRGSSGARRSEKRRTCADHEEKPGDLTCVAKLTDRVIGRLNSARQLKPVEEERKHLCEQDTHLRR